MRRMMTPETRTTKEATLTVMERMMKPKDSKNPAQP